MFGRQSTARRVGRGSRWLATAAGLAIAGATVLAMAPAGAAPVTPVAATFGLTGVTTSNCPSLSTGGADIWVTPGGELDFKTSLASVNLLSIPISTALIAGLDGELVIDPTAKVPTKIAVQTTKVEKLATLGTGDHAYTFTATAVNVGGLLPIPLNAGSVRTGLSLVWKGTIHVTTDAAKCGISVSTPAVGIQLPGMAPIVILPQITVPTIAVPNLVPTGLPLPGVTKSTTSASKAPATGAPAYAGMPVTIPDLVVPKGDGPAVGGGIGILPAFGAELPAFGGSGVPQPLTGSTSTPSALPITTAGAAQPAAQSQSVELASSPSSTAQMPVLLAIIAVIALSLVTATYAKLYIARKPR
ncbi:MAG: hypothetical protein ABI232_02665 [Jatrophihabitantaceae bacterium]